MDQTITLIFVIFLNICNYECFSKIVEEPMSAFTSTENSNESNQTELSQKFHEDDFVGFSAFVRMTQILDIGGIVQFGSILVNEGNFFQPETGIFVCPITGVYYVSVTIRQNEDAQFRFIAVKNDEELMTLHRETTFGWDTVSNNVLTSCNQGQLISVKSDFEGSEVYGEDNGPYSTFTVIFMSETGPLNQLHNGFHGVTAYNILTQSYTYGDTIQLSNTLYNDGTDYNPIQSYYRCPVNGVYLIATTFYRDNFDPVQVCVEKSGFLVPILHTEDDSGISSTSISSNSLLVQCGVGEDISVTATGDGAVKVTSDWIMNTLSVMLIHENNVTIQNEGALRRHNTFIGFSGWKRASQSYSIGDTITFESVVLNEGDAYDVTTSMFTCPVLGVYYISANFRSNDDQPLLINIVRETLTVSRSESQGDYPYDNVSSNILINCFAGNRITLRAAGTGEVYGDESRAFTTLNIMLMYEL